jgi:cell fate (sporulation/competence/biofilm development) regulator YlbF (YheA/YmcA/DUF963 family)
MVTISDVAYAYREAGKAVPTQISLSHIQQLVAAALGHQSLAAYQASEHETNGWMEYIGHIVFDHELLAQRTAQLAVPHRYEQVLALIREAFAKVFPEAKQHVSEEELIKAYRDSYHELIVTSERITALTGESIGKTRYDIIIDKAQDYTYSILPSGGICDELLWGRIIQKDSDGRPLLLAPIIDFQIHLALARTGLRSVRAPLCVVTWAQFKGSHDEEEPDGPPQVSLEQALAEELDISIEEASELVDAPVQENASDEGLIYSFFFDFEGYASPELEKKLGSLQHEVHSNFFDRVSP